MLALLTIAVLPLAVAPQLDHESMIRRALAAGLAVAITLSFIFHGRYRAIEAAHRALGDALEEQRIHRRARERHVAEIEARYAESERFNYTVAHDLKSPLFTVRGFVGFLKEDIAAGNAENVERNLGHIDAAVAKMGRHLDELLELSRVGRSASVPRHVEMTDLAREVTESLGGLIRERGVRIDVAADLPSAFGDRGRLGEVLQNLVENAVKFMGDQPAPRVEISWRQEGGENVYLVRDNGIGIAPRHHARIFDLFDRLDDEVDGSGVGLALAQRIVEAHGGRIWIESEGGGRGTTFLFTIRGIEAAEAWRGKP